MTAQELYDAAAEALACLEGNHPDGAFADAPSVAADILRAALIKHTEDTGPQRKPWRKMGQRALF